MKQLNLSLSVSADLEKKIQRVQRDAGLTADEAIGSAIIAGIDVMIIAANIVSQQRAVGDMTLAE